MSEPMIVASGLAKGFTLHTQGGTRLAVLAGVDFSVAAGECVALDGPSGSGKSSFLRLLYGNYRADAGRIAVRHRDDWVDLVTAPPRRVLAVRRETVGYVSQFLRVLPRVSARMLVAEPLRARGVAADAALARADALLERLGIPARLRGLAPATFSGGEQQRVNIARGLIADHPVLLLDEPTAALDAANRDRVVALIRAARDRGAAIVGIFHDAAVRAAVADRLFGFAAPSPRPVG